VYEKLLCIHLPKAPNDSQVVSVIFALLGSAQTKAACKMLVKSTPCVNFINVLHMRFSNEFFAKAKT